VTTIYEPLASIDIKNFLWYALQSSGFLDPNDYIADGFDTPLVPIIPSQQVPEFNNLLPGKPYLYYDYDVLPYNENWWVTEETMNIYVVSANFDFINKLNNFFTDLLRRHDETALLINHYFGEKNLHKFHYVKINSIMSPKPFITEGGLIGGEIVIQYSYSRLTDYSSNFSNTTFA